MRVLKAGACSLALGAAALALLAGEGYSAGGCTVCHSKDPKMVRMHTALEFKGCPACHAPGKVAPQGAERDKQMREGPLCMKCHGGKDREEK
jgi:hypothetical protein